MTSHFVYTSQSRLSFVSTDHVIFLQEWAIYLSKYGGYVIASRILALRCGNILLDYISIDSLLSLMRAAARASPRGCQAEGPENKICPSQSNRER